MNIKNNKRGYIHPMCGRLFKQDGRLKQATQCNDCKGSGICLKRRGEKTCPTCKGLGYITKEITL